MDGKACAEVLDILKYIPREDYDKISSDYINWLYQNAEETNFTYNAALPFDKQPISEGAKQILSDINQKYWSNLD